MIERGGLEDTWEVNCDACSHAEEIEAEGFHRAVEAIKRRGWRIRMVAGEWLHLCPSCVEDGRHET